MTSEEIIKEELEKIQQIHLPVEDTMNLVLVYLGEKPAYSTTIYYSEKMIGLTLKDFMSLKERLEKELSLTSLNFKIIENKKLDEDGFLEVCFYVFVSKDKKNIDDIERAIRNEDILTLSKLLGDYKAIIIINDLSKSKTNKDFQNIDSLFISTPKDLKEWWESLDKKERYDLKNEKVLNFLTFSLSKKNWREELEIVKKHQKIIKEKCPELYQEIIEKGQAEEDLWPIQSEEEKSVYFKKIIENDFDRAETIIKRIGEEFFITEIYTEEELKIIKDLAVILTLFNFIVHLYDPGDIKRRPFWGRGPFVEITIKNELEYYEDFKKLDWREKEEIEEKRNNFYKKKLFLLLSDFYKNRNVDWDVRLHVESVEIGKAPFILSNIGASFLSIFSEEEMQIKYKKYNEEIKEFTEFLKQRYIENLRKQIFFEQSYNNINKMIPIILKKLYNSIKSFFKLKKDKRNKRQEWYELTKKLYDLIILEMENVPEYELAVSYPKFLIMYEFFRLIRGDSFYSSRPPMVDLQREIYKMEDDLLKRLKELSKKLDPKDDRLLYYLNLAKKTFDLETWK